MTSIKKRLINRIDISLSRLNRMLDYNGTFSKYAIQYAIACNWYLQL